MVHQCGEPPTTQLTAGGWQPSMNVPDVQAKGSNLRSLVDAEEARPMEYGKSCLNCQFVVIAIYELWKQSQFTKYTISIENGISCPYAVWSLTLIRLAEIVCWFELHWKWCVSYTCRWAPNGNYIPSLSFRNLSFQVWWTIKTIKKGTPQKVLCQFKWKIMATLIAIEMCHNIDNQAWGSRHTNIKFLQAPLSTYRSMISFGFPLNPCSHPIFYHHPSSIWICGIISNPSFSSTVPPPRLGSSGGSGSLRWRST